MNTNRQKWLDTMYRVIDPVLTNLANDTLKANMPVEGKIEDRPLYTHLEAFGRTLLGISAWLEQPQENPEEEAKRSYYLELVRASINHATNPNSKDYMNFTIGGQPLVDAAFLAQALLRTKNEVWFKLSNQVKKQVIVALNQVKTIRPYKSNWLLFGAMIDTFMKSIGEPYDIMRVDYAVSMLESWYVGDGTYGDGEFYHFDYYNSYVIHPMLIDILTVFEHDDQDFKTMKENVLKRSKRYALIQERMIMADGSFPAIGRSIAYRTGAFQLLAQMALYKQLPVELPPAQVRCALSAVIQKTLNVENTFDADGWLTIGLSGHQVSLGEVYISTGSLYLCTTVFLVLGLKESDKFWNSVDCLWTNRKIWSGIDVSCDHAID